MPVIEWAVKVLRSGGLLGLSLVMAVENLFPPIPSEFVLPFAGFLVSTGTLSFPAALLASTLGSTLGALGLYALGRYGGRPLLLRWHKILRVTPKGLDRADDWFDRYGWFAVVVGRMVPFIRSVVSVPAGTAKMPLGRFVLLTAFGSGVWNALLISVGMILGQRHTQVTAFVSRFNLVVLVVLVLAAGAWWWRKRRMT